MAEYERPSFRKEWWEKVQKHLEEHPEEGFEPSEPKAFIKYVVNKYMNGAIGKKEEQMLEELEDIIPEEYRKNQGN